MPAGKCPSCHDLEAYVVGALSAGEKQAIARHLSECTGCRAEEQRLQSDDMPLLASLFDPRWPPGYADEPACQQALARAVAFALMRPPTDEAAPAGPPRPKAKRKLNRLRQYRLLERLGGGGTGVVYKARHSRLDRVVAIKVLSKHLKKDPDALARFYREMKVIGKLDHPNIVRATDADEDAGFHYLVMELIEGHDLSSLVQHLGPLPVTDACHLAQQAARALDYIHQHGLVHRDIKPSNMMLLANGQLKLLDLGLSLLRGDIAQETNLTTPGVLMGTCDYISPEQCSDSHHVDIRADLYSLGCTLYELLCGRAPFGGPEYSTPLKKVLAHMRSPAPPITDLRPDLPAELVRIVERLLAKQPNDRFRTPAELIVALQPFVKESDLPGLVAHMERRA
jgi:serine/threonine protein kinase